MTWATYRPASSEESKRSVGILVRATTCRAASGVADRVLFVDRGGWLM
jgi:hypothetical protein